MKIKTIFIISGVLTTLMIAPAWLAALVPSVQEFFVVDGFGETMLKSPQAMEVFDTFLLVLSFMGMAILVPIFGATCIKDLEALKKLSLLFGIMLFLVALPDYISLACGGAHPPAPIMIINVLAYLLMFYGWKKGVA